MCFLLSKIQIKSNAYQGDFVIYCFLITIINQRKNLINFLF